MTINCKINFSFFSYLAFLKAVFWSNNFHKSVIQWQYFPWTMQKINSSIQEKHLSWSEIRVREYFVMLASATEHQRGEKNEKHFDVPRDNRILKKSTFRLYLPLLPDISFLKWESSTFIFCTARKINFLGQEFSLHNRFLFCSFWRLLNKLEVLQDWERWENLK